MKRHISMAIAAALAGVGPALSLSGDSLRMQGPFPTRGFRSSKVREDIRHKRAPGPLMRRSFAEIPCSAPGGYFWKQDRAGAQRWRLYKDVLCP